MKLHVLQWQQRGPAAGRASRAVGATTSVGLGAHLAQRFQESRLPSAQVENSLGCLDAAHPHPRHAAKRVKQFRRALRRLMSGAGAGMPEFQLAEWAPSWAQAGSMRAPLCAAPTPARRVKI